MCLCAIAPLLAGCGRKAATDRYRGIVARVQCGYTDALDVSRSPRAVIDSIIAGQFPNLRHLVLDKCPVTDADLARLANNPALESLSLCGTRITDAGLEPLTSLKHLRVLRLDRTDVTDSGLRVLGRIRSLRFLSLWKAEISGPGLDHLAELPELCILSLDETLVSDQDLPRLRPLKALGYLSVWGTNVSAPAAAELESRFPQLHVNR